MIKTSRNNQPTCTQQLLMQLTTPRVQRLAGESFFWLTGHRSWYNATGLDAIRRVLVFRPDEVGDVILSSAFLRELRHNLPNAEITLVVKRNSYNLVELCPYVNRILLHPIDSSYPEHWKPFERWQWTWAKHKKALAFARANLWREHFDLAIYLRLDADYYDASFLTYASGARGRMAYSEHTSAHKALMNQGFDTYFTQRLDAPPLKHEVERNLAFIQALGGRIESDELELWTSVEDAAFAEHALGSSPSLWVAMGPGARVPRRVWSIENFTMLARWLREMYGVKLVVLGSPNEKNLGDTLASELGEGVLNLVGQTTLRQAAEILKRCALYIGNDSAPLHLAAAAGVPVVEISCHPLNASPTHPNSPLRFGPWHVPNVICRPAAPIPPCHDGCEKHFAPHCILQVTVEQVMQGARELLEAHRSLVQEPLYAAG